MLQQRLRRRRNHRLPSLQHRNWRNLKWNMRNDFRDWSGVKDFRAYNRLKNGEWLYRITRASK